MKLAGNLELYMSCISVYTKIPYSIQEMQLMYSLTYVDDASSTSEPDSRIILAGINLWCTYLLSVMYSCIMEAIQIKGTVCSLSNLDPRY